MALERRQALGYGRAGIEDKSRVHRAHVASPNRATARGKQVGIRTKWDGYGPIAHRTGGRIHLRSLNYKDRETLANVQQDPPSLGEA